ncbi:hypothetical protein [Verrucomicrobium sp. 3C]|uniref:hypothetical protein n=1 Tax=Verrucomicrobium sp. 3C TaxID=1134055 RepID=UPI00038298DE|nr:hypothetical protein [Verrucomicrobium sp. 3C]
MRLLMSSAAKAIYRQLVAAAGSHYKALQRIVDDPNFGCISIEPVDAGMLTEHADQIRSKLSGQGIPKGMLTSRSIEAWLLLYGKQVAVDLREEALRKTQEFEPRLWSDRYQSDEEARRIVARHVLGIIRNAGRKRRKQTEAENAVADSVQDSLNEAAYKAPEKAGGGGADA